MTTIQTQTPTEHIFDESFSAIKPTMLLHMIKTLKDRKWEISNQQKYVDHLKSIKKDVASQQDVLDSLKDTLKYLKGDLIEMKLFSRKTLLAGDTLFMPMMKASYEIKQVISCLIS